MIIDSLDDNVDCSTTSIVGQPTQTKTLRYHTLTRECSIPMKLYAKNFIAKLTIGRR
jgi:hypothetical protein